MSRFKLTFFANVALPSGRVVIRLKKTYVPAVDKAAAAKRLRDAHGDVVIAAIYQVNEVNAILG